MLFIQQKIVGDINSVRWRAKRGFVLPLVSKGIMGFVLHTLHNLELQIKYADIYITMQTSSSGAPSPREYIPNVFLSFLCPCVQSVYDPWKIAHLFPHSYVQASLLFHGSYSLK
jgi:hypothetical protein